MQHGARLVERTTIPFSLGAGQPTARQGFGSRLELEDIMDTKVLSLFLFGLSVGVGITMLFAPKSGQETRALIKGKAREGTEYLKQRGVDVKQTAAGWIDKGREALSSVGEAPQAGDETGHAIAAS
jgi:hypothetical protein